MTISAREGAMALRNVSGLAVMFRCRMISLSWCRIPTSMLRAWRSIPQEEGKELLQCIYAVKDLLKKDTKIASLANYDIAMGTLLTAGGDVWLNTPQPPLEASGTSGMKAALNGVPSLSVLDGWWIEGCIEGVTGWAIGPNHRGLAADDDRTQDAAALYDKLERAAQGTVAAVGTAMIHHLVIVAMITREACPGCGAVQGVPRARGQLQPCCVSRPGWQSVRCEDKVSHRRGG
jgi:hypothetical protein